MRCCPIFGITQFSVLYIIILLYPNVIERASAHEIGEVSEIMLGVSATGHQINSLSNVLQFDKEN